MEPHRGDNQVEDWRRGNDGDNERLLTERNVDGSRQVIKGMVEVSQGLVL